MMVLLDCKQELEWTRKTTMKMRNVSTYNISLAKRFFLHDGAVVIMHVSGWEQLFTEFTGRAECKIVTV